MNSALLDTDTLSEILRRRDPVVATNAAEYLKQYSEFAFSAITNYEIVRGLTWSNAQKQLTCLPKFRREICDSTHLRRYL